MADIDTYECVSIEVDWLGDENCEQWVLVDDEIVTQFFPELTLEESGYFASVIIGCYVTAFVWCLIIEMIDSK